MIPRIYNGIAVRIAAVVGAAAATVILIVAAYFNPRTAAAGWLVGFVFWAQILIGALTLWMIHRLTGGRWGEAAAPAIAPATAAIPFLIVLALPLFASVPVLYPWWHRVDAIKPDVLSYYLNTPAFITRSLIALFGWSALAWLLPRNHGSRGKLIAALGLVFHAIIISGVAVDWFLSFGAPFTSSSFGASVAISSLTAALAWIAVAPTKSAAPIEHDPAFGDISALLLTTVLGITYIDFMAVLVIWYGDIPREEVWFVERGTMPWALLAAVSFIFVSLLPVLALLLSQVRNARRPLRIVGLSILAGLACYDAYLIAPPAGIAALATAVIAIAGIGLALTAIPTSSLVWLSPAEPADAL